jgi:transcriptional regulator with XRE-family HTH domain
MDLDQPSDFSDAIFARRLREFRLLANTTQQELAGRMTAVGHKMHRSAIAKIEVGERPVSIGEAVQFAGFLGVPLTEMVTDPGATTDEDRLYRARLEAQLRVRSLKNQAAEYHRLMAETRALIENTEERLRGAEQHLAGLGGGVAWDEPARSPMESGIPLKSPPGDD